MTEGWDPHIAEHTCRVDVVERCFAGPLSECVINVVRANVWAVAVVVGCAVHGVDHHSGGYQLLLRCDTGTTQVECMQIDLRCWVQMQEARG